MLLISKFLILYGLIYCQINISNKVFNENDNIILNGVYIINSLSNKNYLEVDNNNLILSNLYREFHIINIKLNTYILLYRSLSKILGIDNNNNFTLYNKLEGNNFIKILWNLIKIENNQYLIQNKYNHKFLMTNDTSIQFSYNFSFNINSKNKISNIHNNYLFTFIKLYEEGQIKYEYLEIIEKEPIDVFIKYIDLTDKMLNREGIMQIYKDKDNEELRYCIRSILDNIPWVRKIFIVMPNKKVKYFKSQDEIKEKIIYVNDKDFLGYDSANIFAFTFNLYKMEKFGISKNFIYMEDDFFIGKPLKKTDFFYYDEKEKKVVPYLLTYNFNLMNKTFILEDYYSRIKKRDLYHPHSGEGWWLSIRSTDKFFLEKYNNITIINTVFTHNAIAENIEDLKEIFYEIQDYKYIKETLYSKERNILTLNQPHFVNLYQLNIKHKKINSIPYKYIAVESLNKESLDIELFVINTGGNHIPTKRQFKLQKKIMEKRFPIPTKYEIPINTKKINLLEIILVLVFSFIKLIYVYQQFVA